MPIGRARTVPKRLSTAGVSKTRISMHANMACVRPRRPMSSSSSLARAHAMRVGLVIDVARMKTSVTVARMSAIPSMAFVQTTMARTSVNAWRDSF